MHPSLLILACLFLMICLFVPFPPSGPASFGQFACLDLAPLVSFALPFLGAFFLWSFAGFHHHLH
jgi:hypothetical protein